MNEITEVLEKVYNNLELRQTIVPLFISNPGESKSTRIENFAEEKGVNIIPFITSTMSPFEVTGLVMPDKDTKRMTYFDFDKLEDAKDGDIIFFDELLNGNPNVLNACLTFIGSRKTISGKPLPKVMIVAAANPQGMVPLTPQIKERFVWYHLKFNKKDWIDYMIKKYDITLSIGGNLAKLVASEDFMGTNFKTPRSLDKAVNMLLNEAPTPYKSVVLPILEELIENTTEEKLPLGDRFLEPGEKIKWIDLIRIKKGKTPKKEVLEKEEESSEENYTIKV